MKATTRMHELMAAAKQNLREHGELLPVVLIEGEDEELVVGIKQQGRTAEIRRLMMFALGREFADHRPAAVTSVLDAFMRRGESESNAGSLADDPDARECLVVARLTRQGECGTLLCPYERHATLEGLEVDFGRVEEFAGPEFPLLEAFFLGAGNWHRQPDRARRHEDLS